MVLNKFVYICTNNNNKTIEIMKNLHFNPLTGITTKKVTTPELKKGDTVLFHGAKFLVLEDAYNSSNNESRLPSERKPLELQAHGCKCEFISYEDGSGKKGDILLEEFKWFQGNTLAKNLVIV